ncbi:FtsX-like permease family protein [Alteromonas sp. HB246098]
MLRTLLLSISSLLAMARHRPWEPLLIMVAIVLANAGLVTVLLINEGATQGELLQSNQGLLAGSIITPVGSNAQLEQGKHSQGSVKHEHSSHEYSAHERSVKEQAAHQRFTHEGFTKEDYAILRRHGFTQLIAISESSITLSCSGEEATPIALKLLGVDTQPLLGSTFRATDEDPLLSSLSLRAGESKPASAARILRANSTTSFSVNGLLHPVTNAKLSCHNTLNKNHKASTHPPQWPATVNAYVSSLVPQDTILVSIDDFYKGGISPSYSKDSKDNALSKDNTQPDANDISKQQKSFVPLAGLVALSPLSEIDLETIEALLGVAVKQSSNDSGNDTGSLPDSFRLNLWAMSALMGVVSLFIVLNALNLMYRTRLPNVIRLRQLGISKGVLSSALFTELMVYCMISIPIGMFIGFQAASWLSPVISGTFTSLFNAVFITPDVNLLFIFGFALITTFTSLVVFSLTSIVKLSNSLTVRPAKKKMMRQWTVGLVSAAALVFLFIAEAFITSTASALLFVALLLLTSCVLVLLWLPIVAKLLTTFAPRQWPVFHYVIANMHLLSSKTRLAVCAFFIALTANIGMNTMTDSFRSATEQWLEQRLYAPFYLYTDAPLSNVESLSANSLSPLAVTPLLKAEGDVISLFGTEKINEVITPTPTYVSISSYPVHEKGKKGLVLDNVMNNDLSTAWRAFVEGKGIFINQQLAFALNAELGDTLNIANIRFRKGLSESSSNVSQSTNSATNKAKGARTSSADDFADEPSNTKIFSIRPEWKVLGIYPDYGNINGQILAPLPLFNQNNISVRNSLFSGVLAIYPKPTGNQEVTASSDAAFKKDKLTQQLKAHIGDEADITLYSRQALLDTSMNTFDRTFVLTDGLNITTLLVAGIAFAVSLTVLTIGSSAQLSVLRALGVSQLKVKTSLFMQYLLLCLVSALLAIPFGIYLAYVFINLVNRYAFNWVYPLSIEVDVILSSVGLSLLIVSLVLLLPLGKLKPKIDLRQEVQL